MQYISRNELIRLLQDSFEPDDKIAGFKIRGKTRHSTRTIEQDWPFNWRRNKLEHPSPSSSRESEDENQQSDAGDIYYDGESWNISSPESIPVYELCEGLADDLFETKEEAEGALAAYKNPNGCIVTWDTESFHVSLNGPNPNSYELVEVGEEERAQRICDAINAWIRDNGTGREDG